MASLHNFYNIQSFTILLGWLFFPGLLLAACSELSLRRFLAGRLPHALITINISLAGIIAVLMSLLNRSLRICPVMPLSPWTIRTWRSIAALGALVGGGILFIYEYRIMKDGYSGWSALIYEGLEVRSKSWRRLWWWIVLSILILLVGFAVSTSLR